MFSTIKICRRSKKLQILKNPDVFTNVKKKLVPTEFFFGLKRGYIGGKRGRIVSPS